MRNILVAAGMLWCMCFWVGGWANCCEMHGMVAGVYSSSSLGRPPPLDLRAVDTTMPCNLPSQPRRGTGHGEEAQEGEEEDDEDEGDGIVHWNLRRSSAGAHRA